MLRRCPPISGLFTVCEFSEQVPAPSRQSAEPTFICAVAFAKPSGAVFHFRTCRIFAAQVVRYKPPIRVCSYTPPFRREPPGIGNGIPVVQFSKALAIFTFVFVVTPGGLAFPPRLHPRFVCNGMWDRITIGEMVYVEIFNHPGLRSDLYAF